MLKLSVNFRVHQSNVLKKFIKLVAQIIIYHTLHSSSDILEIS